MPGACWACVALFGPADPRASVIVTLSSVPRCGRVASAVRTPVPMLAPPVAARAAGAPRTTDGARRMPGVRFTARFRAIADGCRSSVQHVPGPVRLVIGPVRRAEYPERADAATPCARMEA
ncbi:hypothetical protein GCM10022233_05680 [Streptomyces shaanxiensis]|uniref:Uncharacterized protein n=1 Tax=Streptomyces shaanxiensis TaxID=653357 RepID=A0ABP7UBY1_9ACTN